jgi:O-antigen/teichoic acid export membrane protein
MSLKQQAIRGTIWSLIQRWGSQGITLVVFLLLARLLEPQAFGLIALATVVISFVQAFTDQGFWDAIVQRRNLEPEYLDTAFWVNISIGILLTLITVATAGFIAQFFREPALTPVIRWLSLTFLVTALSSVQGALLTRELKFKVIAMRRLLGIFVGGITGVIMALLGFGVWSLVGKQIVDAVVNVVVLWNVSNWRPGFQISLHHCKELFSYGVNVVGFRILSFFNRRSGEFLIGYFLGSITLGYYTIAYRVLSIFIEVMIGTIQRIAFPIFSRMKPNPDKLRQAYFEAIQLTSLVAFPAFLALSALAPEIVVVVFGDQWKPSIPVMQVLGLIGLLSAVFHYNDPLLMALGKPQWAFRLTGLHALLNVVFVVVAVRWGIVAVAAAFVVRGYLMSPIMLWVVNKVLPFKWTEYRRQWLPQFLASLVLVSAISGAKYLLNEALNVHLLLPIYLVFGLAIYVATICVIAPELPPRVVELFRIALPRAVLKDYGVTAFKRS